MSSEHTAGQADLALCRGGRRVFSAPLVTISVIHGGADNHALDAGRCANSQQQPCRLATCAVESGMVRTRWWWCPAAVAAAAAVKCLHTRTANLAVVASCRQRHAWTRTPGASQTTPGRRPGPHQHRLAQPTVGPSRIRTHAFAKSGQTPASSSHLESISHEPEWQRGGMLQQQTPTIWSRCHSGTWQRAAETL